MTNPQGELERWERLMDLEAVGEPLTAEDQAFCARYEAEHPDAAAERAAWAAMLDDLTEVAEHDEARPREFADAVLTRHRTSAAREASSSRVVRIGVVSGLGLAAAAVVAFSFSSPWREPAAPGQAGTVAADAGHETEDAGGEANESLPMRAVSREGTLALAAEVDAPVGEIVALDEATDSPGRSCLVFREPWATACFDADSRFSIRASGLPRGARELVLERGRVIVTLDPVGERERFSVATNAGRVTALGTVFAVAIDENSVNAAVLEGRVLVEAQGHSAVQLAAGQTHMLGAEVLGELETEARAHMHAIDLMAQAWRTTDLGALEVESNEGAVARIDEFALGQVPVVALAPVGTHQLAVASSDGRDTAATTVEIRRDARRRVSLPLARDLERPAGPSAAELAARAQEARRARDFEATADLYRQLVKQHPRSPEAGNARVRLGDVLQDNLGDPSAALEAYESYLERPGSLAPEARFGRIRALRRLGRALEEKGAIEAFLLHHADDFRAEELRTRLSAL